MDVCQLMSASVGTARPEPEERLDQSWKDAQDTTPFLLISSLIERCDKGKIGNRKRLIT